ncbi:Uncharacterized protein Rs2_20574 [Raphanus sativus]|nr:Uncharacterized protein Rs2_20574 [Raphanus sativus]
MFLDSPETLGLIDETVRENYMLASETPVLITYGMPDWMMFPSGPSPPITIATTADLVTLLSRRPYLAEIALLVTFGAKKVAEFQFLSRADFTIGCSTYVVGDGQDESARARYESLVLGERLLMSERVMSEIFGEQDMLVLHRVALEMAHADRVMGGPAGSGVPTGVEIIQLDDDDDMTEASQTGTAGNGTAGETRGAIVPFQPQPLAQIPPAQAPPVLWDVGMDMLDYPEFYNAQRDGRLVVADAAFWNDLIDDNNQSLEGVYLVTNTNRQDVGLTQGESSPLTPPISCTQIGDVVPTLSGEQGTEGGVVDGAGGTAQEKTFGPLPGPSLKLSLACGSGEPDATHSRLQKGTPHLRRRAKKRVGSEV